MYHFWSGEDIWCTSPQPSDAEALMELLNDSELQQYSDSPPVSKKEAETMCSGRFPWFIVRTETQQVVGAVALLRGNRESAEICILLQKSIRRHGSGSALLQFICKTAAIHMKLQCLYARVLIHNQPAIQFFKKNQFEQIPVLPEHLHVPDEKESVYFACELTPFVEQRPLVSVIIPMYNIAAYLPECLRSLQKYQCEIIVIDDSSEDNTLQVAKDYAAQLPNMTILEMKGKHFAGGARNVGMRYASGEYLFFLDGDDIVCEPSMWEKMLVAAWCSHADVITTTEYECFDANRSWKCHCAPNWTGRITQSIRPVMFSRQFPVWMSWFRREWLEREQIHFLECVRSYEDNYFTFLTASTVNSVYSVAGTLTKHLIRQTSLSHIKDVSVQTAFFSVTEQCYAYASKVGLLERFPMEMISCFYYSVFCTACHVQERLLPEEDWIIPEAVKFLRAKFPSMPANLPQIGKQERERFLMEWGRHTNENL